MIHVDGILMIGMILIRVRVNMFIIVNTMKISNVNVQVILNVAFIKVIWKDQAIQDLWFKI